jgi:hypothetical protein
MKSDDITKLMNVLAAPYSTPTAERDAMQQRLYSAVLTISTFKGISGGAGSSWPAFIRDVADHLDADDVDPRSGRLIKSSDLSVSSKYQPTAKEIDACLPTMELLSGFHTPQHARAQGLYEAAAKQVRQLEERREAIITGKIPCAIDRRAEVVNRLGEQITFAQREASAKLEFLRNYAGSLRKAVGALKAAARFEWLGRPRSGLTKWERAAAWAGVKTKIEARLLHDEAILWACAVERKKKQST